MDSPIYMPSKQNEFGILLYDILWNQFKIYELTEIMRQKNDLEFIVALNNLASGCMTDADTKLIKSREVNEKVVPQTAIWLFGENAKVDEYNQIKIGNHPGIAYVSNAKDVILGKVSETTRNKVLESLKKNY